MTDKKRILITDRFSHEAYLTLSQQAYFEVEKSAFTDISKIDISSYHGLIIRSRTRIDQSVLENAKKLQLIISATSGFDHIDLEACSQWGITVMHTPYANVESAAQHTWSLALACANKLIPANRALKAGEWNREFLVGTELSGKTYGIVGLGRIGKRVAQIANVFGMKVQAFDPYAEDLAFDQAKAQRVSYEEILKTSDVLSFHVPKTRETDHMLNRSHFEYIHRGIILINTSRGSVIKEADLVEALDNGWIGSVGLDVYEKEPLPRNSKLLSFPQAVLSPHLGANTTEAFQKASEEAALKCLRFFIDSSTSDTLPPKAAWYGAIPPWENS